MDPPVRHCTACDDRRTCNLGPAFSPASPGTRPAGLPLPQGCALRCPVWPPPQLPVEPPPPQGSPPPGPSRGTLPVASAVTAAGASSGACGNMTRRNLGRARANRKARQEGLSLPPRCVLLRAADFPGLLPVLQCTVNPTSPFYSSSSRGFRVGSSWPGRTAALPVSPPAGQPAAATWAGEQAGRGSWGRAARYVRCIGRNQVHGAQWRAPGGGRAQARRGRRRDQTYRCILGARRRQFVAHCGLVCSG
jgi:hypothetical protein